MPRWQSIPLDIIHSIMMYLIKLDDLNKILSVTYPNGPLLAICKDGNSTFWKQLYCRDISSDIKLLFGQSVMQQYYTIRESFNCTLKKPFYEDKNKIVYKMGIGKYPDYTPPEFIMLRGYPRLFLTVDLSKYSDEELKFALKWAIRAGHREIVDFLVANKVVIDGFTEKQ